MSTNRNLLTSPVGTIQFMAAENPVKQSKSDDKQVYTIKLAFDVVKDAAFLAEVAEVNDAKVVTAQTYRGKSPEIKALLSTGKALVGANSNFKPEVYDSKGNTLEEAPNFFGDSTGTAQMIVQPWKGDKGGTINLIGIIIHEVNSPEGTNTIGTGDREARLAQLREAVALATK
jgi:hypothetical protein